MPMYTISILPLIDLSIYSQDSASARQMAFADDFTGIGTIEQLKIWWDTLNNYGPYIGYYPNASRSVLVVKEEFMQHAVTLFADTNVQVTASGNKHLGACVGSDGYRTKYVEEKVRSWIQEIKELSRIARMHPHAAYIAYTKGLQHRHTYICLLYTSPSPRDS